MPQKNGKGKEYTDSRKPGINKLIPNKISVTQIRVKRKNFLSQIKKWTKDY